MLFCNSEHKYLSLLGVYANTKQIMDREKECVCCHEIEQVANKNELEEVMEYIKPTLPYDCLTDKPGFHTVCLDKWVLQAAWLQYKQQYRSTAYEGPDDKISRHMLHTVS